MANRCGNSGWLYFWGLQNHLRWWLQPWNKKMLTPWKESYDQPRQHIKKQRHYFTNKGPSCQDYGFSSSHVCMWELDCKEKWSHSVVSDSLWPVDCSLPSSSVHGILQARILEWVAISFSFTVKKAEHQRIDAFELWCWRRLLRVTWTARRSNQSILKEISPGCSLEGLMLKLKFQ